MAARPRVLVVDDERGVRESLRALLEGDCDVVTAASGEEALGMAEKVDVATLDLRLPGLGGITVLKRLKALDPEIGVLIITGYVSFDTAVQGLRCGAFDYVVKPFEPEHVRSLVQAALAHRAARRWMAVATGPGTGAAPEWSLQSTQLQLGFGRDVRGQQPS